MEQQNLFVKTLHAVIIALMVFSSVVQPILAASSLEPYQPDTQSSTAIASPFTQDTQIEFPPSQMSESGASEMTSSTYLSKLAAPMARLQASFPQPSPPNTHPSPAPRQQAQSNFQPLAQLPSFVQEQYSPDLALSDPLASLHPLARVDYEQDRLETSQQAERQNSPISLESLQNFSADPNLIPLTTNDITTTLYLPIVLEDDSEGGTPPPPPTGTITPEEGGVVASPDGQVSIVFAPGAVETIAQGNYTDAISKYLPPSLELVGPTFDLIVNSVVDNTPITFFPPLVSSFTTYNAEFDVDQVTQLVTPTVEILIQYDQSSVANVQENRLRLYRQSSIDNSWKAIPTIVDSDLNTLRAPIERSGRYTVLSWPLVEANGLILSTAATLPHIVLDPDHGGANPGGEVDEPIEFATQEKIHNLQVGLLTRDILQTCGMQVDMTRESDISLSTFDRATMINALAPDAAVTIAFNVAGSRIMMNFPGGPLGLIDVDKLDDVAFAREINAEVATFTGLPNFRDVEDADTWGPCGGVCTGSMVPDVLYSQSELAFLDSYTDREFINNQPGAFAGAVSTAIINRFGGPDTCEPGFELPDPLSAEERARLRNLAYQYWMRYRGDPVNTSTGNHVQQFTDLDIPGVAGFDFVFQRTYNSLDEREGAFGFGWSSMLDMNLRLANDGSADLRYADGSGVYFVSDGEGGFVPGQDGVFDTLTRTGPDFMLTTPDQMFYFFDGQGDLLEMSDRFENTIVFERNGDGQVTQIVDSAGRTFDLTYNGDHVTAISDPSGRTITYSYDGNGDLISVTNGNGGTQQFTYDNHLMTMLTDPEGILYLQNFYDGEGRVIEQIDASGNHDFFNYDTDGLTPFDDNSGNQTQDSYDDLFRVTQTVDALGQTESFVYDADYNVTRYTDKRGHTWTYTYDERGNLLTETDPLGFVTSYTYNGTNDLTSITDQGGPGNSSRTTTFVYDDQGNLIRIERPDGTTIEATYDAHGQLLSLTDGNGNTTTYEYDAQGNLINVTDPNSDVTSYTYDAVGRMTSVTDANGHTAAFIYDGNDNITHITDPKSQIVIFTYDLNDNLTQMVDRRGGITTYQYDENLKLIAETDPEGHTTSYAYDEMYNRISMTDPRGNTTLYRYDDIYQLLEVEHALGGVIHFAYDENGNVSQVTDSLGQVTSFNYDPLNRLEAIIDALGGVTQYVYDAVGRLIQETNPRGAVTTYEYDLLGQLVLLRDALNGSWQTGYDNAGNVTSLTDSNGHAVILGYDPANRLIQRIDAGGHSTHFAYDGVGNITQVTDALGRVTHYAYDENDNLITITDTLGQLTQMAYDQEDNLISLTDANAHTTQFEYNLDGMLIRLTEAGGQVTTYAYDPAHNLTTLINAKGNSWLYTYDALNRRENETDPLGNVTTFAYDLLSRLTHLTDANGIVTRYDYDALDRLVAVIQNEQLGSPVDHETNVTTTYQYDSVGNLTAISDANGHTTTFGYDLLDRLIQETNPLGNTWQYGYDPVGNLTTRTDANGQVTLYTYDADNLLVAINYPDGTSVTFGYDAVHNQTSMTDWLGLTQNEYDNLNRLAASLNHLGQRVGYSYDAVGNRTALTYPDGRVVQYDYDATNFVERVTDPDGNVFAVTRDATHNIVLTQNPNQTRVEYDIDAAERLAAIRNLKDDNSLLNTFAYTLDPVGNRLQTVAAYSAGQPTQLTTDYQYDPLYRLLRSDDDQGHFTAYSFDAVGNRLQLTTNYDPTIDRQIDVTTTDYSYNAANQLLTTLQDIAPRPNGLSRGPQTARPLHAFVHEVTAQDGKHIETATAASLLAQANALIADLEGNPPPDVATVAAALASLQSEVETAATEGRIDNAGVANSLTVKLNRAGEANAESGGELQTALYDYDLNGSRIRRTATVDSTGNPADWVKIEYSYDVENRLTLVQFFSTPGNDIWLPGDETQLTYDGYGRLYRRLHDQHQGGGGQSWVDYVYDGLDPIVEYLEPSPQYVNYYRGLGRILSMRDFKSQQDPPGTAHTFHYDGLGSVSMMTNHQGQSAHNYRYSDYGTILDNNSHAADASNFTDPHNHYTYTGQEWDEQTELLHFYAREYDLSVGVWLQQDPYRGMLMEPMTLHRYGYVGDNPVNYMDLDGLDRITSRQRGLSVGRYTNYSGTYGVAFTGCGYTVSCETPQHNNLSIPSADLKNRFPWWYRPAKFLYDVGSFVSEFLDPLGTIDDLKSLTDLMNAEIRGTRSNEETTKTLARYFSQGAIGKIIENTGIEKTLTEELLLLSVRSNAVSIYYEKTVLKTTLKVRLLPVQLATVPGRVLYDTVMDSGKYNLRMLLHPIDTAKQIRDSAQDMVTTFVEFVKPRPVY